MNEKMCTINVHLLVDNCTLFYSYRSDLIGIRLAALNVL